MDDAELERQVSILATMNANSSVHGDICRFTKHRTAYFQTTITPSGPSLVLNYTNGTPHDVFLASRFRKMPPFCAGHPSSAIPRNTIFTPRAGFVYNEISSNRTASYTFVSPVSLAPHRHASLARPPRNCPLSETRTPPWLLEFANVWMSPEGELYLLRQTRNSSLVSAEEETETVTGAEDEAEAEAEAQAETETKGNVDVEIEAEADADAYSFQGGCCSYEWANTLGEPMGGERHRRVAIGFSLLQYHGSTYSHVLQEVLPRLLTFWEVAVAVMSTRGGKVVGSSHLTVVRDFLRSFGVPDAKMLLFGYEDRRAIFFERLFVPAPFLQDAYARACVDRAVASVLKAQYAGEEGPERPMVLLLERARSRSGDGGACAGMRCLANFHALCNALRTELAGRAEVRVLAARDADVLREGVRMFARAMVVVGVHGAAFANIPFLKGKGTHCVHLGWRQRWQMYARLAKRYDVGFVNILTKGAGATRENVVADIPVVVLEVRRRLEMEGVVLGPPIIETNATRNRLLSISMG